MGKITSDYLKPYEDFVPKEKHIQSKEETFTVERYNSLFRHFLARMRKKSKCYSKKNRDVKIISIITNALQKQYVIYT